MIPFSLTSEMVRGKKEKKKKKEKKGAPRQRQKEAWHLHSCSVSEDIQTQSISGRQLITGTRSLSCGTHLLGTLLKISLTHSSRVSSFSKGGDTAGEGAEMID